MIGQNLGSFRIVAWLGGASMGRVFRGVEKPTGRTVAIKVASDETQGTPLRFLREAKTLYRFRHPHIPQAFAWGRRQEISYLAMEYIGGPTLAEVLAVRGALPLSVVVEMGLQICEALQYIHEQGVVHRHVKPSHFILTEQGRVKLVGFGLARFSVPTIPLAAQGRVRGTPGYLAPEQICGAEEINQKADLYALGVVLYKMLVGKLPFDGDSGIAQLHCHLIEPPPRPSDKVTEVPQALDRLIIQLMAKSPADRPRDAAEVKEVLSRLRDQESHGVVKKALRVSLARRSLRSLLLRRWPGYRPLTAEARNISISRDSSPCSYLEDSLWDQELDG